jgi:predicted nuclease with TOPRIM domain
MLTATQTEKREIAKKLQALANELNANTEEFKRLRALDATPEYSIGFILSDVERLSNTFYYLENEIKKLKLEINYLRCKCNVESLKTKRTLEYNALVNTDYDNIDF